MQCDKRVQLRKLRLITKDMKRTGDDGFWRRKVEEPPPPRLRQSPEQRCQEQWPQALTRRYWSAENVIKKYIHLIKFICVRTITFTRRESVVISLISRYLHIVIFSQLLIINVTLVLLDLFWTLSVQNEIFQGGNKRKIDRKESLLDINL